MNLKVLCMHIAQLSGCKDDYFNANYNQYTTVNSRVNVLKVNQLKLELDDFSFLYCF